MSRTPHPHPTHTHTTTNLMPWAMTLIEWLFSSQTWFKACWSFPLFLYPQPLQWFLSVNCWFSVPSTYIYLKGAGSSDLLTYPLPPSLSTHLVQSVNITAYLGIQLPWIWLWGPLGRLMYLFNRSLSPLTERSLKSFLEWGLCSAWESAVSNKALGPLVEGGTWEPASVLPFLAKLLQLME